MENKSMKNKDKRDWFKIVFMAVAITAYILIRHKKFDEMENYTIQQVVARLYILMYVLLEAFMFYCIGGLIGVWLFKGKKRNYEQEKQL
jgi:hypothetical protein